MAGNRGKKRLTAVDQTEIAREEWSRLGEHFRWTGREAQIAQLLFDDLLEKQIARRLSVSENTLKTQLRRLYRKMSVHNRAGFSHAIFKGFQALPRQRPKPPPPVTERLYVTQKGDCIRSFFVYIRSRRASLLIRARATPMRTIIVLRCLGVLLLVAAGLKAYGLAVDPVGSLGWFSSSWFQFGLVEVEVLLGLWLLAGSHPRAGWLTVFGLFSAFAVVSFYQGMIGQASCGCFGKLQVSPWCAFGIDLLVLTALVLRRPNPILERSHSMSSPAWSSGASWTLCAAVVLASFAGLTYTVFGAPDAAVAYFRGEKVSIGPRLVNLGVGATGETRQAAVELVNRTEREIRVIGGTSDCSCITTHDLPLALAPAQVARIKLTIRFTDEPGLFTRTAELFVDTGRFERIRFRLTGRSAATAVAVPGPTVND